MRCRNDCKLYDKVILKDGRHGDVVEILEPGVAYLIDVELPGPDWDTIEIRHSDISKVLR